MNNTFLHTLFIAVLLQWVIPTAAQDISQQPQAHPAVQGSEGVHFAEGITFDQACQLAAQQQKLVFVDCYTTWCGPCKRLARDVFPQPVVGQYFNANFISIQMDMEKGEGPRYMKQWDVNSFPTLIIFNPDGRERMRYIGLHEPEAMVQAIQQQLGDDTGSDIEQRYLAQPTDRQAVLDYVAHLRRLNKRSSAQQVATAYLNTLSTPALAADTAALRLMADYVKDPHAECFTALYAQRHTLPQDVRPTIVEYMEYTWRSYTKHYYSTNAESHFTGVDEPGMAEYYAFMQQHGVEQAEVYYLSYRLPGHFGDDDPTLLLECMQMAATVPGYSQTQFEYACRLVRTKTTDPAQLQLLETIEHTRNTTLSH